MFSHTSVKEYLFDAITNIDDKFISEVFMYNKNSLSPYIKRFLHVAAILIIIIISFIVYEEKINSSSNNKSFYIVSAVSADGSMTPLSNHQNSFNFNSGTTNSIVSFPDKRTFALQISPSNWNFSKPISSNMKLSVECDDPQINNSLSEHISIVESMPIQSNLGHSHYFIFGWFDQEIKLTFIFSDRESGNIIEKINVQIIPDKDSESYMIRLTP